GAEIARHRLVGGAGKFEQLGEKHRRLADQRRARRHGTIRAATISSWVPSFSVRTTRTGTLPFSCASQTCARLSSSLRTSLMALNSPAGVLIRSRPAGS